MPIIHSLRDQIPPLCDCWNRFLYKFTSTHQVFRYKNAARAAALGPWASSAGLWALWDARRLWGERERIDLGQTSCAAFGICPSPARTCREDDIYPRAPTTSISKVVGVHGCQGGRIPPVT